MRQLFPTMFKSLYQKVLFNNIFKFFSKYPVFILKNSNVRFPTYTLTQVS
jgi:hypothetical protein